MQIRPKSANLSGRPRSRNGIPPCYTVRPGLSPTLAAGGLILRAWRKITGHSDSRCRPSRAALAGGGQTQAEEAAEAVSLHQRGTAALAHRPVATGTGTGCHSGRGLAMEHEAGSLAPWEAGCGGVPSEPSMRQQSPMAENRTRARGRASALQVITD